MRCRSGLTSSPIEFLPRRFYLVVVRERPRCSINHTKDADQETTAIHFPRTPGIQFISLQEQLLPSTPNEVVLGIAHTIRFNSFLTGFFNSSNPARRHYFFLRRRDLREEIQAIHLICRWRLLYLQLSPREALAPFEHLPYLFSSFLSPSGSFDPPNLLGSLGGIAKGLEKELVGPLSALEQSDEANLWTISRRFIVYRPETAELEHTIAALKRRRVSLVVVFSKTHSDTTLVSTHGLEILDFSDDKVAPLDKHLVNRFLEACESTDGVIAVDGSNPGNMSVATCIGCYLMKHSNLTAQEAIGWLQFCLPGKIPTAGELFLGQMQVQMWQEGGQFRQSSNGLLSDDLISSQNDSSHINIGKISLGRLSLLGTREKQRFDSDIPASNCLSSRSQEAQRSPTAATSVQLKRRPLTQGSVGSRRYHRNTEGSSLRADFALMHKFLHQTPTPRSTSNSPASSLHSVPSRPKGSSRSSDGTPANCTEALA